MATSGDSRKNLTGEESVRLARSYARAHGAPESQITLGRDGGFRVNIGPLLFEFIPEASELVLRATVLNDASDLKTPLNHDVVLELDRIQRVHPEMISDFSFEIGKSAWPAFPYPSLYLKTSIKDSGIPQGRFLAICDKLSLTAYRWFNGDFEDVLDRVMKSRKKH